MRTDGPLRVAVIIASTRSGRFGPTAAAWFTNQVRRRHDLALDAIDLADTDLPATMCDDEDLPAQVQALAPRLAAADAFVIVTPEYNRSFPASLKVAIDWFYDEWAGKPVTFVSYGRESGGLHAASQLREVFSELNAVTIRNSVSLPCYWEQFAADGSWPKARTASSNLDDVVRTTVDQLIWWAHALRAARAEQPCPT
ncbi:NADPH-dependent FMN reductase [Antrihabitans spumae]|jgi:NAD(P)H-dependent FMN reductase|uniref:NADPH-dependent FMN reductase n=1 Tax=Antrihabitans spumae TaxID=3373370 RepID=A0ABW7JT50_9NOCA